MRSVADMSRPELEQALAVEIANARSEARPISRLTLTRLLQSKFPINPHDAERFVDNYCDDKAPGVPTYLSSEFGVPYLKVVAFINVAVTIGMGITAAVMMRRGGTGFLLWLGGAVVFLGAAAFCYFQSVRPQKEKAVTRMPSELPNIGMQTENPEPVATGSLQSRS